MNDEAMVRRAMSAWFRTPANGIDQPSAALSTVERVGNLSYVVLRNVAGVMVVYRIKTDGALKRLIQVPKAFREIAP